MGEHQINQHGQRPELRNCDHRVILEQLIPERHDADPWADFGAGVWLLVVIMLIGIVMMSFVIG